MLQTFLGAGVHIEGVIPAVALVVAAGLIVSGAPGSNAAASPAESSGGGATSRESVSSREAQLYRSSFGSAMSSDGRYLVFHSLARHVVAGDTNAKSDVFLRDRGRGITRRVSVGSHGTQSNGDSWGPSSISADGRYVAFHSVASNLVPDDTNHRKDVFVRDRVTHVTRRTSLGPANVEANGRSYDPVVSADGRFVAFHSYATNLVAADHNGDQICSYVIGSCIAPKG